MVRVIPQCVVCDDAGCEFCPAVKDEAIDRARALFNGGIVDSMESAKFFLIDCGEVEDGHWPTTD